VNKRGCDIPKKFVVPWKEGQWQLVSQEKGLHLIMPLPPSANDYHEPFVIMVRGRPKAAMRLTTEAKHYKAMTKHVIESLGIEPTLKPVAARYVAYFPDRRRDLTNVGKVLWDAIEKSVYKNDRQIYKEGPNHVVFDKEYPRVEVFITAYVAPEDWGADEEEESLMGWEIDQEAFFIPGTKEVPTLRTQGLQFDLEDEDEELALEAIPGIHRDMGHEQEKGRVLRPKHTESRTDTSLPYVDDVGPVEMSAHEWRKLQRRMKT
jgi:Holliday junction resolvase RusA-like endonuclease